MTDQELRALVRDAVARHLGAGTTGLPAGALAQAGTTGLAVHASHAIYVSLVNPGGECVIEPSVPCNHCNYCKSHGH